MILGPAHHKKGWKINNLIRLLQSRIQETLTLGIAVRWGPGRYKREQSLFMMRVRTEVSLLDMFKHFTLLTSSDDRSRTTHHSGSLPSNVFHIKRLTAFEIVQLYSQAHCLQTHENMKDCLNLLIKSFMILLIWPSRSS